MYLISERINVGVDVLNPSIVEGEGAIKYAIFKDLWQKNYHITSGSKFGSDYLVYPGILYITNYIIVTNQSRYTKKYSDCYNTIVKSCFTLTLNN